MSDDKTSQAPQHVRAEDKDTAYARLVTGRTEIDFMGRSRLWAILGFGGVLLSILAVLLLKLEFSIEFTGGSSFVVEDATEDYTVDDLEQTLADAGVEGGIVQIVDGGSGAEISTPTIEGDSEVSDLELAGRIEELTGGTVNTETIGPRWGDAVTNQAIRALVIFLVLVVGYIAIRFEWRMAVSAFVTLVHDIALTIGLYAVAGFTVSPSTVIAFLTILGFSLYDTVVVFDRIAEDSARLTGVSSTTYAEMANGSLNHVLVRSLSTSATAVLPVASLLFVGATLLGAETLKDLALALFIGMIVGAYSSIIIATPMLVWLKEKEPKFAELKARSRGAASA